MRTQPIVLDFMETHDTEPCKHHIDDIINRLESECDLATQTLTRSHDLSKVSDGISRRKERSVQPSSPLANELRKSVGYVRLADGSLYVFEYPVVVRELRTVRLF